MRTRGSLLPFVGLALIALLAGCSTPSVGVPHASPPSTAASVPASDAAPAASTGWRSLSPDNFYATINSDAKVVATYITPSGVYCPSDFMPGVSVTDMNDIRSVNDPDLMWRNLAGDRDPSWMTTGEGCSYDSSPSAAFDSDGHMVEVNESDNGTQTYTRQITVTDDGFHLTSTTDPGGTVKEYDFVAFPVPEGYGQ